MRKVIIVDDDQWAIADICFSFTFEKHGFTLVATCTSAEEALPIILNERPQLVITDICMGQMNGIDLVHACREKLLNTFFIVISGYDLFEYAQKAMNEGANYYLLKPIDTDEVQNLMTRITRMLIDEPEADSNCAFAEILKFVKEHYNENLTLNLLSKRFYLDNSYLSRTFSKNLGMTFTEYKQKLQISKAMELLDRGCSINETAQEVGFNDVRYFFRVFKKIVGTTPNQYKSR